MSHWSAALFALGLEALAKKRPDGQSAVGTVARTIWRHPLKLLAAFVMAPFLAFRVAATAKNPARRAIAGVGLFVAVLMAWLAGTLLGTASGALLVASGFGLMWGLAFFIGTAVSVVLSVTFSILVFNAVAYFFLQASSEEVLSYLKGLSE